MAILKLNSDNVIKLVDLTDAADGTIITGATVTVSLYEPDGTTPVTGETFPLAMPHTGAGTYEATLNDQLVLNTRKTYKANVIADAGVNKHREWCVSITVECS